MGGVDVLTTRRFAPPFHGCLRLPARLVIVRAEAVAKDGNVAQGARICPQDVAAEASFAVGKIEQRPGHSNALPPLILGQHLHACTPFCVAPGHLHMIPDLCMGGSAWRMTAQASVREPGVALLVPCSSPGAMQVLKNPLTFTPTL